MFLSGFAFLCSHITGSGNRHKRHRANPEQKNANRARQTRKTTMKVTRRPQNKAHTHFTSGNFVTKDVNATQGQTLAQSAKFTKKQIPKETQRKIRYTQEPGPEHLTKNNDREKPHSPGGHPEDPWKTTQNHTNCSSGFNRISVTRRYIYSHTCVQK